MSDSNEFTCSVCKETFSKGWSDEEAKVEAQENFGDLTQSPQEVVCDACYQKFMKWFKDNSVNQ